jgi:NAD(P)-dependent dehydrogenase (short-subunit alcohol dehydrogenase family)
MGLAIAERFAKEGYDIALMARDELRLSGAAVALSERYRVSAHPFSVDLSDLGAIGAAFASARERLGDPGILVYNAARWHDGAAMTLDPEAFARDLALNVGGALVCAQLVFGAMQAKGEGTLLFTGGGLALRPQFGQGAASLVAGKSALRGLVLAMAGELAGAGVHAATVTIAGTVAPNGPFDPQRIADVFWLLHSQARSDWSAEVVFDGKEASPSPA